MLGYLVLYANLATTCIVKFTTEGSITIQSCIYGEPDGLRAPMQTAVEIVVADTGRGIASDELDNIFREFEQVESSEPKNNAAAGLGQLNTQTRRRELTPSTQ